MATTSIPLHELVGDNSPPVVLDLMAGLVGAAMARNVDVLHPAEVVIGRGARVNLMLHRDLPPHPLTSAPELRHQGGGPATLVYAVGALGALATLGAASPAPIDDQGHAVWLRELCGRLAKKWAASSGGSEGVEIIRRCLDRDPAGRPSPLGLIEEVRGMGFPSEQGLVSRTGFAPPSLEDLLPAEVPLRSQGMQAPSGWPPVLSVVPRAPSGPIDRPRVKVRPPRVPPRKRGRRPEVRWIAVGIGMVLAVLVLAVAARVVMSDDPPAAEPTVEAPGG